MTDVAQFTAALADRYRIERELGRGGMATVYLARDLKHDRDVALKVLRPELAAVLGRERFLAEIRLTAKLDHPHILALLDSGENDGFLWYTLPFIRGESLRQKLQRERQLDLTESLGLARQVLAALGHAHDLGIVHRDVKPENILLHEGEAMLADFGIALAVREAGGRRLTETGLGIGTPQYMSPEQATAERMIDARSDIYSLAAVLYEMLTGEPPFTGSTAQAVIARLMTERPTPLRVLRDAVPIGIEAAVARALEKVPADRFPSAATFSAALATGTTPVAAPTPRKPPRRLLRALGLVAFAALVSWAGWRALRRGERAISVGSTRILTREPGLEIMPAISPDGREVAYRRGTPRRMHIEVQDIAGGRPRALTDGWSGTQGGHQWSATGDSIRFVHDGTGGDHPSGVWVIPRMGGQAAASGFRFYRRADSAFMRNPDSSETVLTTGAWDFHSATRSPDGSSVAYVLGNRHAHTDFGLGNIAPSAIWVVTPGSAPRRVTDGTSLNTSPAWLPDGRLLFVSNRDGPRDLYVVRPPRADRPVNAPTRLTTGLEAHSVSVSADGRTVAYDRFTLRRNIYILPIPRTGSVSVADARPLTQLNQVVEALSVSRDDRWLVYDSNLHGGQDIYLIPTSGGEPFRVTRDPADDFSPDFSPDGREIAFHSARNETRDIYLIKPDGRGEQRLTSDSAQSLNPKFSPDGLRLAYQQLLGALMLLKRDSIGAEWSPPRRVATAGFNPEWSIDGNLVFQGVDRDIRTLTVDGVERVLLAPGAGGLQTLAVPKWSRDGQAVYFCGISRDGQPGLYEISTGSRRPVLRVRGYDASWFAVGQSQFYLTRSEPESDIYVMDLVYH